MSLIGTFSVVQLGHAVEFAAVGARAAGTSESRVAVTVCP
jgi:hypothetical protein